MSARNRRNAEPAVLNGQPDGETARLGWVPSGGFNEPPTGVLIQDTPANRETNRYENGTGAGFQEPIPEPETPPADAGTAEQPATVQTPPEPETAVSVDAKRPKRENFNPDANAENLNAVGFVRGDGGNWYTVPDAAGGSFYALERVVQGGRYYLIRYDKPLGSPVPRPVFRTPFEPVFYPR